MSTVPDTADARSGIIDCSVSPCPSRASGEVNNYVFMIDRISDDGDTVFARYSFQHQLTTNGDYTMYFDGCCRAPELLNNPNLVFHLRTGIQLYASGVPGGDARDYPQTSIKFACRPWCTCGFRETHTSQASAHRYAERGVVRARARSDSRSKRCIGTTGTRKRSDCPCLIIHRCA